MSEFSLMWKCDMAKPLMWYQAPPKLHPPNMPYPWFQEGTTFCFFSNKKKLQEVWCQKEPSFVSTTMATWSTLASRTTPAGYVTNLYNSPFRSTRWLLDGRWVWQQWGRMNWPASWSGPSMLLVISAVLPGYLHRQQVCWLGKNVQSKFKLWLWYQHAVMLAFLAKC